MMHSQHLLGLINDVLDMNKIESGSTTLSIMTANAFVEDVRDAIEAGMDAHIAKPVQVEVLKDTIRQMLDSRREQKEKGLK